MSENFLSESAGFYIEKLRNKTAMINLPVESEIESNLREWSDCNVPLIANSYQPAGFLFANCATFGEFVIEKEARC